MKKRAEAPNGRKKVRESDALPRGKRHERADVDAGFANSVNDLPVGLKVRVARLNSLVAVRAEAARLYREARQRHGKHPDAQTAFRLSRILLAVANSIELLDLEARIQALEKLTPKNRRS